MIKFRIAFILFNLFTSITIAQNSTKNITLSFLNTIHLIPIKLTEGNYTNTSKENFTISTLKYYISNIEFHAANKQIFKEADSYHLVDEADSASKSFSFFLPQNNFSSMSFMIGVDSLKNVSGAQTDALDPLNGMFWTWNTGYIMFKLEGKSPKSTLINNKIEYHIGGFKGNNNVLRSVEIQLPAKNDGLRKAGRTEIIIGFNLDKFWNADRGFSIATSPTCTTPGSDAAKIATNYSNLFHLVNITYKN